MTANSKIANAVYIEFVRLLYTARWPIVVVGCAMLTTGLAVAWQTRDVVMAVIGLTGMAVTLGRLALCSPLTTRSQSTRSMSKPQNNGSAGSRLG